MRDFSDDFASLAKRLNDARTYLRFDELVARKAELDVEISEPGLWDDPDRGRVVSTEHGQVTGDLEVILTLEAALTDARELFEIASDEGDDSFESDIETQLATLEKKLAHLEIRSLFSGEHDEADAICTISAKDGGTDAQDWAEMLLRMYGRWAEQRGLSLEVDDVTEGTEAGILSASFTLRGRYAYGLMVGERGVHRLVRISPFDSQARRQTSFAAVNVVPLLEAVGDIELDEKDLRIDTYRSSGAGGQHVNKTSSAIRITHLPTGMVVACQNERSQLQNKNKAMATLTAMIAQKMRDDHDEKLSAISGKKALIGWGAQIRSYVMAPYQLVKDLRSEHETGNVQGVLDGDLDPFMEAWLKYRRATENA